MFAGEHFFEFEVAFYRNSFYWEVVRFEFLLSTSPYGRKSQIYGYLPESWKRFISGIFAQCSVWELPGNVTRGAFCAGAIGIRLF